MPVDIYAPKPCARPGCRFERVNTTEEDGNLRARKHCGGPCWVWAARARRVQFETGPLAEAEAADLLRIAADLDARETPDESARGLYQTPAKRRFP